ncbi:MAG TPA: hypothetical protein PK313_09080 [Myxococcota bacterium]|jgi:hypothetical protein|nr:hypothetical protein [Myxococcota bacterium]
MGGPAFDKGLESLVAEVLRVHVVEAVFSREAVRKGLPPDRVEALRREVVDRLKHSEDAGREHRDAVKAVVDAALGLVPGGATAATVLHQVVERLVPSASAEARERASDPAAQAGDATAAGGDDPEAR